MNGHNKFLKYILALLCCAFLSVSTTSFAAHISDGYTGESIATPAPTGTLIIAHDDGTGGEDTPPVPVPAPAAILLLALGLLLLVSLRRRSQSFNTLQE